MPSRLFRDDVLEGQVALVTGGGTGIGVAIARELLHQGARVVIASRKAENVAPAAEGLRAELGLPEGRVRARVCDIRDREAVAATVADVVGREGRLDVLVNNGGGQFFSPADAITPKGWDAVVATNLTGTWNVTRAAADAWMLAHGGVVVNITMLTRRTFPGMAHSVAARAGVEAMTRTLAVEWASRGVRVNCVAPGLIASTGLERYPAGLEMITGMRRHVPAKRLGTCEEVAWWVAFLAGPGGGYVTGQTMTVDGGKELWGDWWEIPEPAEAPVTVIPKEPWQR